MTTATPDLAALLAALDSGDDGVLPVLADWLEEQQDPRAEGLRLVGDRRPLHHKKAGGWPDQDAPAGWQWYGMLARVPMWAGDFSHRLRHVLPVRAFDGRAAEVRQRIFARHPTRSAAFLALAAVLGPELCGCGATAPPGGS